ncbi:type II toxin-antitoxin system VapC family toxin [Candidatus Poribacteria bacterium]|nr:type II toxin-antitoxin system VapC family toxin [Candidatus Poribacteria bacterium]MYA99626.1 type II toxin-antitoxin system VapC family toxin [Candidatus Poribacteria bacterium]
MNLLLDTCVLLWWLDDPDLLSKEASTAIKEPDNKIIVSVVSAWEIAIKKALGKLESPENLKEVIIDSGFELIPIDYEHTWHVKDLPLHHKDPFDRLLVAQATVENLMLVTCDPKLKPYNVPILEA